MASWAAPERERGLGGVHQPCVPRAPGRGERRRLGQHARAGGEPAAPPGCVRHPLEPVGHVRIGAQGGLGGVPCLDLDQPQVVGGLRQGTVGPPALGALDGVVRRRADQWVAEGDRGAELHEVSGLRLLDRVARESPGLSGRADEVEVARGVGGRDQQPGLEVRGEVADPSQVERLEVVPDRQWLVGQARLRQPPDAQLARQVHQGERVAPGGCDDLCGRGRVDRLRQRCRQQPHGPLALEPGEAQAQERRPAALRRAPRRAPPSTSATDSASSRRATSPSTSRDSGSSRCASSTTQSTGSVSPAGAQEAQHAEPHQEPVGRLAQLHPGRHAQGLLVMALGQLGQVAAQGDRQPLHASERDHRLSLEPVHPEQAHAGRVGRGGVEEGGLPHPRLAGEEQRSAAAVACLPDQGTHLLPLGVPPEETLNSRHLLTQPGVVR